MLTLVAILNVKYFGLKAKYLKHYPCMEEGFFTRLNRKELIGS